MYDKPYHTKDLSQFSFLITGGAGFIGSNIVEYLLKYNAKKVRVLDNFSTGFRKNTDLFKDHPAFELIEGDIRDIETCKKVDEGLEFVFNKVELGFVQCSINDKTDVNESHIVDFMI